MQHSTRERADCAVGNSPDCNFAWLLWRVADERPDAQAIAERDRCETYAQLRGRSGALARALVEQGIRPGDRVAILLERGIDAAAAYFGALAAGGVPINVNETLRSRQIEHVLAHADARALLTSQALLARLPRPLNVQQAATILTSSVASEAHVSPTTRIASDIAQIIYTSGSTGLPKGVTLSHGNLWAVTRSVTTYLDIATDDRIASLLPFSFGYGLTQLFCSVAAGATLVVERSPLPPRMVETVATRGVTVLACVPPLWHQLLSVSRFRSPLPALRTLTNAGGRLPTSAVRSIRQTQPHANLYLMYGLTEALRSAYLPPNEVDLHPDSFGRAIPGAELFVLDDALRPCAPGEVGELVHRGPTVALGYWKDPVSTERVFRANPMSPPGAPRAERVVFSGDLVRADETGRLYYVGRRDRLIKSLGFRVSPEEVADVLFASGEVADATVVGEDDADRGTKLVAFVVLEHNGSAERLDAFCKTELPRYMQPSRIEALDELPRLANGKHDLRALAAGRVTAAVK